MNKSGRAFKQARKLLGLSQIEMANELAVNQSTISRIEKGVHEPDSKLIRRLEKRVGISARDLSQQAENVMRKSGGKRANIPAVFSMTERQRLEYLYSKHMVAKDDLRKRIDKKRQQLSAIRQQYGERHLLEQSAREDLELTQGMIRHLTNGKKKIEANIIEGLKEKETRLSAHYTNLKDKGASRSIDIDVLKAEIRLGELEAMHRHHVERADACKKQLDKLT